MGWKLSHVRQNAPIGEHHNLIGFVDVVHVAVQFGLLVGVLEDHEGAEHAVGNLDTRVRVVPEGAYNTDANDGSDRT